MPAAAFHPDLAGRQINLVIEDEYVLGRDLLETRRLGHGKAGFVHKALWLDGEDFVAADPPFGDLRAVFGLPWGKAVPVGKHVECHETGIVPVPSIVPSRVAKACEQQHVTLGSSNCAAGRSRPA